MRNFIVRLYKNRLNSQKGVAALMAVIIAMVVIASIGLNFVAETQQEQAGSTVTYTSTNAFLISQAGLRYAEKCLKQNLSGCPCYNTCSHTNWPTANILNKVFSSIAFGDTRGSFTFIVTSATTSKAYVTATGTFAGATRELSKNITPSCAMSEQAATSCTGIMQSGNASISPSTSVLTGSCSNTAVSLDTFPSGAVGCPNASYPAFSGGVVSSPYQYCSWTQTSGTTTVNGNVTIYVQNGLTLSNSAVIAINGNVTIDVNSGGNVLLQNQSSISITSGSLTIKTAGTFTLQNNATINYPIGGSAGSAGAVMVMVQGATATLSGNAQFSGGIYAPSATLSIGNNSTLTGAVVANSGTMTSNASVTFDTTAGNSTNGYSSCSY